LTEGQDCHLKFLIRDIGVKRLLDIVEEEGLRWYGNALRMGGYQRNICSGSQREGDLALGLTKDDSTG